jgi:hypothetical protein
MASTMLIVAVAAASLGLFAAAYGVAMLLTRPARPRSAAPTPDLGEEPPAVVNLLANRWRLTEDAVEATLLDLAARRLIELRQPANDPMHTTVHLPDEAPEPGAADLNPYERIVLERVRVLAVGGVVPVTALTFRNANQARGWNWRLHRDVIADAQARGLSRRRLGRSAVSALVAVAAVSAAGLGWVAWQLAARRPDNDEIEAGLWVSVVAFAILAGVAGAPRGERDTPAGRQLAAQWLGVREWLRRHEEFANLPPAAVTVWDRYLPYGAALGVTHTASAVLDLGMGDRRLVWSSYGDGWRRVRVRYPKFWSRYGRTVPSLLVPALFTVVVGGLLVRYHRAPVELNPTDLPGVTADRLDLAARLALILGALLLARGGYRAVRALADLATTRTITGEVLWLEVWRKRSQGNNRPSVPWLHYLAVDDGTADRTTAWGLPHTFDGPRCGPSDTVTIRVRRWSRRVIALDVTERGRASTTPALGADEPETGPAAAGGPAAAVTGWVAGAIANALTPPDVSPHDLVTAAEVGQALGLPVRPPEPMASVGPVATASFATADRGRHVLLVQVVDGGVGRRAWRANLRGTPLPGIGDEAVINGDRAVLRVGDTVVLLTLMRDARGRNHQVPWLLAQAAARLATQDRSAAGRPGGEPAPTA